MATGYPSAVHGEIPSVVRTPNSARTACSQVILGFSLNPNVMSVDFALAWSYSSYFSEKVTFLVRENDIASFVISVDHSKTFSSESHGIEDEPEFGIIWLHLYVQLGYLMTSN
jgi:hypothetical protein